MKKEDINTEIISKIELLIDDTLFYMPGEIIKGKIRMNPIFQIKLDEKKLHLTLNIMQYEFWDYTNIEIKELKNIYITKIQQQDIEYRLKEEETPNPKNFLNFSVIEKEEKNKNIEIPFQIKIDNPKILPTFQFEDKKYILGIRHLLIVECHEYHSSNYIGLFIGKAKDLDFAIPKEMKESFRMDISTLEVTASFPKLSYKFNEEINVDVKTNSNLRFKKITEIERLFYRKIEWIGYMKNSLLDRNVLDSKKFTYNENKYELSTKLKMPLNAFYTSFSEGVKLGRNAFYYSAENKFGNTLVNEIKDNDEGFREDNDNPIDNAVGSLAIGVIAAPVGMIYGLFKGFYQQGDVVKEILNINKNQNNIESNFSHKIQNEEFEKLYIENLKKFVYFKDDKVVGFIKFSKNILPPVKGYYFKCYYNIKIEVKVAGIIANSNKELKTKIDLYDYKEYIQKMKAIFKN